MINYTKCYKPKKKPVILSYTVFKAEDKKYIDYAKFFKRS